LQVAHLVSAAALTRDARQAFFDRADHARRPVTDHVDFSWRAGCRVTGSSRYDSADIKRAAADATSGAEIKPVLLLPQ
jgi:hypothetical protein